MKRPTAERSGWRLYAVCATLFCGTLLLFSRAVNHDFLDLDDPDYITRNIHVQSGITRTGIQWAFTSGDAGNWHPLTWLSHMLDCQLFGSNPHGHHTTNIFWHALNAVMAFLALRRLTGAFWTSAVCAALFAWHPLRVESVAWVSERKDLLCAFFGLLTLWAYAVYAEKRQENNPLAWRHYMLAVAAFAAGLLSKPMLVTLPCLLLLLDRWPLRRAGSTGITASLWLEKTPFFALSAASCVVTYLVQRNGGAVAERLSFDVRLENAVMSVVSYLGKFFWPFDLAVGYPLPRHWPVATVAVGTVLTLAVTGVALWQWRRRPWLATGWLWFLGMLVPVIGLVQVGLQAKADRYTYLPILGVQLALLWTVREWTLSSSTTRRLATAAVALALAGCAARTWNQLAVWQNSHTLYEHALAVTENNYLAHCYLGSALFNEGRLDKARFYFRRALEIKPDYVTARFRLGIVLERLGHSDEALAAYAEVLRIKPDHAEAHYRYANALAFLNRDYEALSHYEKVLQLNPNFAHAQCSLADSLRALNRADESCAHYHRALALDPNDANAYYGLGSALEDLGRSEEALDKYRHAIELRPGFADAQYNVGVLLFSRNQMADAIPHFQAAIDSRANYAAAYLGLGLAEATLEKTEEAIRHLEQALQLDPGLSDASETLAQLRGKPVGDLNRNQP